VEFYSSSVLKELKGEEETGWRRFSGGSEGGMTALWFGSLCAEDGGAWHGDAAGGAAVPMEAGGGSQRTGPKCQAERAVFGGSEGEPKMVQATKWAESQGSCSINSFFKF
jgi:hypothetical protein